MRSIFCRFLLFISNKFYSGTLFSRTI